MSSNGVRIRLERPTMSRAAVFLSAAKNSRVFHRHWGQAPSTLAEYRRFVERARKATHFGHFVVSEDDDLAGVININEVVRGSFCSGYLGYYALAPYQGRGYMREGLRPSFEWHSESMPSTAWRRIFSRTTGVRSGSCAPWDFDGRVTRPGTLRLAAGGAITSGGR